MRNIFGDRETRGIIVDCNRVVIFHTILLLQKQTANQNYKTRAFSGRLIS